MAHSSHLLLPSVLDHPAGQSTQARSPFSNLPAGHSLDELHTPSLLQPSAVQPWAMATDVDPPTAMEPASGLPQLVFPWFLWSHPLGQLEQASGLVLPELLENLPGAHALQPETLDTPVAEEKVPAEQFRHAAVMLRRRPVAFRPYFPGGHGVHKDCPASFV